MLVLKWKWKYLNRHVSKNGPELQLAMFRNHNASQFDLQMRLLFEASSMNEGSMAPFIAFLCNFTHSINRFK